MIARILAVIAAFALLSPLTGPLVAARADVAQAKATGGIIALYPREVDTQMLAVPGGEAPEDLHVTLVNFGQDVRGLPDSELRRRLGDVVAACAQPVDAQVFGHGVFKANNGQPNGPTVYLVGDSTELVSLQTELVSLSQQLFALPPQHEPWIPHITAAYGLPDAALTYTGPVVFDRIGLSWAGDKTYWPI